MADSIRISDQLQEAGQVPDRTMAQSADTDLWIFRDGKQKLSGSRVAAELVARISESIQARSAVVDALIQAGEIECALADVGSPGATRAGELTDILAHSLVTGVSPRPALRLAEDLDVEDQITVAPPEGFTFYALHPLDFAAVTRTVSPRPAACAVIGVRSIGTTLSAVAEAALGESGRPAERITVRPTGHPYGRTLKFTSAELAWVRRHVSIPAQFLIVDEGPGRSGSTFLAVAEELLRVGVPASLITVVGSRAFEPEELCATDAAERWRNFNFISTAPSANSRFADCKYLGGGDWRNEFLGRSGEGWPATWPQMERLKFLAPNGKSLFKFEGMGRAGAQARERAFILAENGFSAPVEDVGGGFLSYDVLRGRPMQKSDVSAAVLDRFAEYCAFRVRNFATHFPPRTAAESELGPMLEDNLHQEFGLELRVPPEAFNCDQPVVCDGSMQPYEWILTSGGRMLKTDATSHGDNHFFPGPCGIEWDLAGATVEWDLGKDAIDYVLRGFERHRGGNLRNLRRSLERYRVAYTLFRAGFWKMAASTVRRTPEEPRVQSAYLYYRSRCLTLLRVADGQANIQDLLDCGTKGVPDSMGDLLRISSCNEPADIMTARRF
jgi:hypothetical protein